MEIGNCDRAADTAGQWKVGPPDSILLPISALHAAFMYDTGVSNDLLIHPGHQYCSLHGWHLALLE